MYQKFFAAKSVRFCCLFVFAACEADRLFCLKGNFYTIDAGSQKVEKIQGEYEPWFTPVFETALNGEIPGEIESLLFCVQTGISVGIMAFLMGRFVERKKIEQEMEKNENSSTSC